MWRPGSASSGCQAAVMLMSWAASRWAKAVASSSTRATAPQGEDRDGGEGRGDLGRVLDDHVDHLVGEGRELVPLPVVVEAVGHRRVEHLLVRHVRLLHHRVERRGAELTDGPHGALALLDRPRVADDEGDDRLAVQLLGHGRQRGRQPEVRHDPQLVGRLGGHLAQQTEHLGGVVHRPRHHARGDDGPERVEAELERRDDAEVAAAAPEPPEQVGVLLLAGDEELALGGDDVAGDEVVDREPALAHEVADPPAQGQAPDAGVAHDAPGRREPERLALAVDVVVQAAALGPDGGAGQVEARPPHG
jgi:hypothetical protein